MDDYKIFRYLLDLEKQAAALVDEAQAEADQKTAEGEKQNRIRSEELYARELEVMEKAYAGNIAAVKENYRKQLDEYRESLQTQPVNEEAFFSLAEKLLIGPGALDRKAENVRLTQ